MATYVYESVSGDRIELQFPLGKAPDHVEIGFDGEGASSITTTFRRIIAGVQVLIPGHMRAAGDDDRIAGRRTFVENGDAWLVKTGRATTADMGKAMEIINSRSESEIRPPANYGRPGPAARARQVEKASA